MFGLGTTNRKPRINLVISIGSSSVRASFVSDTGSHERPVILTHDSVDFQDSVSSFSQYVQAMSKACGEVFQKSINHGTFVKPERIICVLEKPWYLSQTHTYSDDRNHEFVFTKQDTQHVLAAHVSRMQDSIQTSPFANTETRIIEKRIVHSAVNGYEVDTLPSRVRLKKIDITSYVSVAPSVVLDALQKTVTRYVAGDIIFATSSLAFFAVTRTMFEDIDSYICLSVFKQSTEISYIDQGALLSMSHFMQGTNEVYNHTDGAIHNNTLMAHMRLMDHDILHKDTSDIYHKKIAESASRWGVSFARSLNDFARVGMKSDIVVVLVEKDYIPWVKYVITDVRNNHLARSNSGFRVILVTMDVLDDYIGSKVSYPDPVNTLHSIFLTLFIN